MKPDEVDFLLAVYRANPDKYPVVFPRDLIPAGMHRKRAWFLLLKWAGWRGWYSYGVCLDLGWLTEQGRKMAESLIEAQKLREAK